MMRFDEQIGSGESGNAGERFPPARSLDNPARGVRGTTTNRRRQTKMEIKRANL